VKKIKGYLNLCYDIEMIKAEIRVLRKQKREIEFQISKLSGAPASHPSIRYQEIKIDHKYAAPPQLEALWLRLEEISAEIGAKEKDLKSLEYRKKNIDKIIEKMDQPKNRVAILREIKGRTLAEIADELGYSESHIKRLSAEISQEIYSEK
jgi:RNA polymerase sigma factor (sigma-70 family)